MTLQLRLVSCPPPTPDKADHGLVFTDILFGFVIYELFTQFNPTPQFLYVWLHLLFAAFLVLGSWIGFRRSRNRLSYELKFFNLPFMRFVLDQAMIVLYFRIATLAKPGLPDGVVPAPELAQTSLCLAALVFSLYVAWDLLGLWMLASSHKGQPKYKRLPGSNEGADQTPTSDDQPDYVGVKLSVAGLVALTLLCWWSRSSHLTSTEVNLLFASGIIVLLLYRLGKEIRTSHKLA